MVKQLAVPSKRISPVRLRVVISGDAGSGKSKLLDRLFITLRDHYAVAAYDEGVLRWQNDGGYDKLVIETKQEHV